MQNNKKSFLRWAGSKQKLIPVLKQYWPEGSTRYIEPFMGSAQLFFSLDASKAILSDTNLELVQTYIQVKKNPYPIFKILKKLKVSEKDYYRIRSCDPSKMGVNQRAARFIYLNQLCFNGIYRTNMQGKFNVPFSGENNLKHFSLELLVEVSKKLKAVEIIAGDFQAILLKHVKRNDFVYLDPPFAVENRKIFKQYGPQTFGTNDLERLNNTLKIIDKKGAKFLLSYAYSKEALSIINNWYYKKVFVQRNISGFSKYRRKSAEILISNFTFEN